MLVGWNGETLPDLSLEREIELASAAGYGGIELFVPKLRPFLERHSVADLAWMLEAARVQPLSMNGIENINLRSAEEFEDVKNECRWLAGISSQIGCKTIVVVPSPLPAGISREQVREETIGSLGDLADIAAKDGVGVAFEFLAPATCSVRTLTEAWDIVQATGRANAGLVFDTYHFHVGGSSWEALEAIDIDRVFIVHVNDAEALPLDQLTDAHRLLPGEGFFPLQQMFAALERRGYHGPYSLEVMRPAYRQRDPLEYTLAGLRACRAALEKAGVS